VKTGLSTGARRNATDRFLLSPATAHFCTFCVDKIVSKALVYYSSHWFTIYLLPCAKIKQAISAVIRRARRHSQRWPGIFTRPRPKGTSTEFCTNSVD